MNLNKKLSIVGFCALVFVVLSFAAAGLADEMTITGKVTDEGILADDEQLYAVADNDKAQELLDLMDQKVEVTGTATLHRCPTCLRRLSRFSGSSLHGKKPESL